MKNTMKLMLVITFLCGSVIADDGNQGSGGRNCNPATDPGCSGITNPVNGDELTQGDIPLSDVVFGVIENVLYLIR